MVFITDARMWRKIAEFARDLGNNEEFISKTKQDFDKLMDKYIKLRRAIGKEYHQKKLDTSISMQNFYPWWANLLCFYTLIFSGFRHTALRELRFCLEASARCYYLDRNFANKSYEKKKSALNCLRWKKFKKKLLNGLVLEKREEIGEFYKKLCDYVHLSEESQTDALRDFSLNILLSHPQYEKDREMLEKTFDYSSYLLSQCFEN